MPRGVKIALIVFAVVGAGLLSLYIWGYRAVTRSLPQTGGENHPVRMGSSQIETRRIE